MKGRGTPRQRCREHGGVPAPTFEPMLATTGSPPANTNGWSVEPKLDGWRAIVTVTGGTVKVRTRSGRLLQPHSVAHLQPLTGLGADIVFDAELTVGDGHPDDFHRIPSALARPGITAVTLWVFDVLWVDGRTLARLPHRERRATLDQLEVGRRVDTVRVVPSFDGADTAALLAACETHGMEGVVVKDGDSMYLPGRRSTGWRKVKCDGWRTVHAPKRQPRHTAATP